jgi:hypothetical protein
MKRTNKALLQQAFKTLAGNGVWLVSHRALGRLANVEMRALSLVLWRHAEDMGVRSAARGYCLNPYMDPPTNGLSQLAGALKPRSRFYLSLESVLHEVDWISQVPNRLTFVVDGRGETYTTPLGTIEFVRSGSESFDGRYGQTYYDDSRLIRVATPELALSDLRAYRRSMDLVRPESERSLEHQMMTREMAHGINAARAC